MVHVLPVDGSAWPKYLGGTSNARFFSVTRSCYVLCLSLPKNAIILSFWLGHFINRSSVKKCWLSGEVWNDSVSSSPVMHICHIISYVILYHLFLFRGSVQDYKIHMGVEIVIFA